MSKLPVGIQLYSVRDAMEADFAGTLKKIKEMGYDAVEFAGLFDHSADEVKALCEEIGLIPISAHVGRGVIMADVEKVIGDYATIGCKYIAIPWASCDNDLVGSKGYDSFLADLKVIAAECAKYGMKLLYHNHDFEFAKYEGKNKLDILYADTTPDVLQTQIDTCWAKVGGEDPAKFVMKYAGRAPLVHLKDFVGSKSANMYALIDGGVVEEKEEEIVPFELRPVGYGIQDVLSIIKAAENAGAEMFIVEQDNWSLGRTSMESAKLSIDYIKNIYN
ncbi:MAG: sugar phosphate isomerase/epimerase [Acutalibacteraceae bacterium]|nr:sugar phosphate isomerase/epimerase [Acutalibacteraceae bacterium]